MIRLAFLAVVAPVALLACSENGFVPATGVHGMGPDIDVSPTALDFGRHGAGEQATQSFTVTNIGNSDLTVTDLAIDGASFSVVQDVTDFTLAPGDSQDVDVSFTPMSANDQLGAVTVFSDDPDDGAVEVDLLGLGSVPELAINPDPLDFGEVNVGCVDVRHIHLSNVGTDNLVISAVDYAGDQPLHLMNALSLPVTLAPGDETSVDVQFRPNEPVVSTGELAVTSNDPVGVVTATQTGTGAYAGHAEDDFTVPENPPVDIVFAVDQSCSMDSHAQNLASNFQALADALSAVTNNWRVGVVTLENGCFNGGTLTPSTPGLQSKFTDAVRLGDDGVAHTEALFTLVKNALAQTPSGCNAGFLRSSALLHVVFVSDEWEQSGSMSSAAARAATFVGQASAYKTSPTLFRASGIICPESGCSWSGIDGQPDGYREAVALTGGARLDISTSNWGASAAALAEASLAGLYDFDLSRTPDPTTIHVWLNGVEQTSGWTYDVANNQVDFYEDLSGGDIVVKYSVRGECG